MTEVQKRIFITVGLIITMFHVIHNYQLRNAFKLFDSKAIAGHIQHISESGYWDKIILSEDSDVYYCVHAEEMDLPRPKRFSAIAICGDSVFKPEKSNILKLIRYDGVHYFFVYR